MSNISTSKAVQAAGYYREVGPDHNARRIIGNLLDEYNELRLESDREEIHRQLEIDKLADERDQLREALEALTSACESGHRIVFMGWAFDKYEFAYSADNDNPVKAARSALEATGGQDE